VVEGTLVEGLEVVIKEVVGAMAEVMVEVMEAAAVEQMAGTLFQKALVARKNREPLGSYGRLASAQR
jgi:hypothetical protein